MSLLFETIKIVDGRIQNLRFHQERMKRSVMDLFPKNPYPDLKLLLSSTTIPAIGIYKCNIVYDTVVKDLIITPYKKKKIINFYLVKVHDIEYNYKWLNRGLLIELKKRFKDDEEVIIVKNGLLSDTTFSNIVFFDGKQWLTPKVPLLKGTKRQQLLEEGLIVEKSIKPEHLKGYKQFRLINAMLEFDENNEYDISSIQY